MDPREVILGVSLGGILRVFSHDLGTRIGNHGKQNMYHLHTNVLGEIMRSIGYYVLPKRKVVHICIPKVPRRGGCVRA